MKRSPFNIVKSKPSSENLDEGLTSFVRQKVVEKLKMRTSSTAAKAIDFSEQQKILNNLIIGYLHQTGLVGSYESLLNEAQFWKRPVSGDDSLLIGHDVVRLIKAGILRLPLQRAESTNESDLETIFGSFISHKETLKQETGCQNEMECRYGNNGSIEEKLNFIDEELFNKTTSANNTFFKLRAHDNMQQLAEERIKQHYEEKLLEWKNEELSKVEKDVLAKHSKNFQTRINELEKEYASSLESLRAKEREANLKHQSKVSELDLKYQNALAKLKAKEEIADKTELVFAKDYEARFKNLQAQTQLLDRIKADYEKKHAELKDKEDSLDVHIKFGVQSEFEKGYKAYIDQQRECQLQQTFIAEELKRINNAKDQMCGLEAANSSLKQENLELKARNQILDDQLQENQKALKALEEMVSRKVECYEERMASLKYKEEHQEQQIRDLKEYIFQYRMLLEEKNRQTQALVFDYENGLRCVAKECGGNKDGIPSNSSSQQLASIPGNKTGGVFGDQQGIVSAPGKAQVGRSLNANLNKNLPPIQQKDVNDPLGPQSLLRVTGPSAHSNGNISAVISNSAEALQSDGEKLKGDHSGKATPLFIDNIAYKAIALGDKGNGAPGTLDIASKAEERQEKGSADKRGIRLSSSKSQSDQFDSILDDF